LIELLKSHADWAVGLIIYLCHIVLQQDRFLCELLLISLRNKNGSSLSISSDNFQCFSRLFFVSVNFCVINDTKNNTLMTCSYEFIMLDELIASALMGFIKVPLWRGSCSLHIGFSVGCKSKQFMTIFLFRLLVFNNIKIIHLLFKILIW